jgi:adenylate cyclase
VRNARFHRLRGLLYLIVGTSTAGFVFLVWGIGTLDSFERQTIDARFSIRGTQTPPKQIVFVAIDDVTFGAYPRQQWPYPRRWHAQVIDRIAADHPKAIAVDIQFTEPTDDANDGALLDSVANAGNVVLATTETLPNGQTRIFGGNATLRDIHARPASGLLPTDAEGVIRKVPHAINGLKTLAVVSVETAERRPVKDSGFPAWIDYAGPAGTLTTYSYSNVRSGHVPKGAFTGKIVVIGPSAPTLQDIHETPVDALMPGGEIQANAVATVLHGLPLTSSATALTVGLILLFSFLVPGLSLGLPWRISLPSAFVVAGLFVVAVQVSFNHGRIVSFVYPLTALALSTVGSLAVQIVMTAFEREQVRDVFTRFVPESVVAEVLKRTDSDLRLGGVAVEGTVLFTDLRGFTTASEHLSPAQVLELINMHLEEVVGAVLDHGGTLVSYTGDGVFAVFGAPIEQDDHAQRAFDAAREILSVRLPRWNEWLAEQGFPSGFRMGIGLNSGPFMSGNIGSAQRLAYTAMGDTINTASRVEQMTKTTGHMLLVAGSTRDELDEASHERLVYIDEVEVRGRTSKLPLWGLPEDE